MERISSECRRVMLLRAIFERRAIFGSAGSAAPARATKPSRFLRVSAAAKDSPNSFATAAVIALAPLGRLREKTRADSANRTLVVRAPISTRSEHPLRLG